MSCSDKFVAGRRDDSAYRGDDLIEQLSGDRAVELRELTADIVAAFVSSNPVPAASLADLIALVHLSLSGLFHQSETLAEPQTPAVNPKTSISPDYMVCLKDGKKFKSHLGTDHNLTPDQYRTKWELPNDTQWSRQTAPRRGLR